jgi:outer membrane protein assembly factor BamA
MMHRAIILALLLCSAVVVSAQEYKILELNAVGSQRYKTSEILRVAGLELNKVTQLSEVRNAAQKLVSTGVFLEVRYSHTADRDGMKVEFQLKDKPSDQYLKCDFSNLVWFKSSELLAAFHENLPLFDGTLPAGDGEADAAAAIVQEMLEQKGVHTHVSAIDASPMMGKPIQSVTFELEEVSVTIAGFKFPGMTVDYQNEFEKAVAGQIGKEYIHIGMNGLATDRLAPIYRAHGRLRANFDDAEIADVQVSNNKTTLTVVLPVHEGLEYTLTGVNIAGNKDRSKEEMLALVKSPTGKLLNGVQFDTEVRKIKGLLDDFGYFRSTVEAKPVYDDVAKSVSYNIEVFEGDRYAMGKLEVEGVSASGAELIRTSWKQREGDFYNKTYTMQFLGQFQFSKAVNARIEESPDDKTHTVDVTIVVRSATKTK